MLRPFRLPRLPILPRKAFDRLIADMNFTQALSNVRRRGRVSIAFVLGLATPLAFAPFNVFPLVVFTVSGLFLLLNGQQRRTAFYTGMAFGNGMFLAVTQTHPGETTEQPATQPFDQKPCGGHAQ